MDVLCDSIDPERCGGCSEAKIHDERNCKSCSINPTAECKPFDQVIMAEVWANRGHE
jgi:hypothetical protein